MLRPSILEYTIQPTINLKYTNHSKVVAFADDLIIMMKAESIGGAENIDNVELNKITEWATDNKIRFNEEKIKGNANDKKETKRTKSRYILEQ
jgi:hypothetical protein